MADLLIIDAVWKAIQFNDFSSLNELLLKGEKRLLDDPEVCKLISDKFMGAKFGKKPKLQTIIKADNLASNAYFYHGYGYPKWNDPSFNSLSAARMVGQVFGVSESVVKKAMEDFVKRRPVTANFFYEVGRETKALELG